MRIPILGLIDCLVQKELLKEITFEYDFNIIYQNIELDNYILIFITDEPDR